MSSDEVNRIAERIEALLDAEDWGGARERILDALSQYPSDHWLLAHLCITLMETTEFSEALHCAGMVLRMAPRCPLALWEQACALDMLLREEEAILVFNRIVSRDWDTAGHARCLDTLGNEDALISDAYFRIGECYQELGQLSLAAVMYERAMTERNPKVESTVSVEDIQEALSDVQGKDRQVWIGMLDVKPRPGNGCFGRAIGAYCAVVGLAESEDNFRQVVIVEFDSLGIEVQNFDEICVLKRWMKVFEVSDEILELVKQLSASSPVLYGMFYAYEAKD